MNYKKFLGAASATLLIVIVIFMLAPGVWAQSKYKTLYEFNKARGRRPHSALIFDAVGNLYGTTWQGGAYRRGVVFRLTPSPDGSWTESVLHSFCSDCSDGQGTIAGLTFDQAGSLYGTTEGGGTRGGGTVFKLTPNADGSWTESVLYSFCSLTNCSDGRTPQASLIFDESGNLYGTTTGIACSYKCGVVFKLTPSAGGSWTESVLYSFCSLTNCSDGANPNARLIFDAAGNLYGTTASGGNLSGGVGCGVVFKLTPSAGGSWTESVLYSFCSLTSCSDGQFPDGGLIFDESGNLYGTTVDGGAYGVGTVFKLTPNADGGWNETVLHAFADRPGAHPRAGLIFDAKGNLYGTTANDDTPTFGSVFEITP